MAAPTLTVKVAKVPKWMLDNKGIDITSKVGQAVESVGSGIEAKKGRGLGAQRNAITRQAGFLEQRVFTSLRHPRRTGTAYIRNQTARFKSIAPRTVNKYVTKAVEAEWAASGGALP